MPKHVTQNIFFWISSESKNGGVETWPIDRILRKKNLCSERFPTLYHFLISSLMLEDGTIINHCLKM